MKKQKKIAKQFSKKKISASKNRKLQIVRNAFCRSFAAIRAKYRTDRTDRLDRAIARPTEPTEGRRASATSAGTWPSRKKIRKKIMKNRKKSRGSLRKIPIKKSGVKKSKVANRPKRVFPKFRGDRSEVRGANRNFLSKCFVENFFPASKNRKLQIVCNAFCRSFAPIGAKFER